MSTWTEVSGIIVCDYFAMNRKSQETIKEEIRQRCKEMSKLFDIYQVPHGTEDTIIYCDYDENNPNIISIHGSLRDFDELSITHILKPWWENIMKNLTCIRQAIMIATLSSSQSFIFERRIDNDDVDLCKLYNDKGIVLCTNREDIYLCNDRENFIKKIN